MARFSAIPRHRPLEPPQAPSEVLVAELIGIGQQLIGRGNGSTTDARLGTRSEVVAGRSSEVPLHRHDNGQLDPGQWDSWGRQVRLVVDNECLEELVGVQVVLEVQTRPESVVPANSPGIVVDGRGAHRLGERDQFPRARAILPVEAIRNHGQPPTRTAELGDVAVGLAAAFDGLPESNLVAVGRALRVPRLAGRQDDIQIDLFKGIIRERVRAIMNWAYLGGHPVLEWLPSDVEQFGCTGPSTGILRLANLRQEDTGGVFRN